MWTGLKRFRMRNITIKFGFHTGGIFLTICANISLSKKALLHKVSLEVRCKVWDLAESRKVTMESDCKLVRSLISSPYKQEMKWCTFVVTYRFWKNVLMTVPTLSLSTVSLSSVDQDLNFLPFVNPLSHDYRLLKMRISVSSWRIY